MQFPRWLKITYWGLLFAGSGWLLAQRYFAASADFPTQVDGAVAAFWCAMALVPLFSEITVGAISLKQEVERLKDQVTALRSDLALAARQELEDRIRTIVREEVGR
jgi:hypothetical protein